MSTRNLRMFYTLVSASCLAWSGWATGQDQKKPSESNGPVKTLNLHIGKSTLLGNFRESNDDALFIHELKGFTLCLAADGMGPQVKGKVLGQIACARASEALTRELQKNLTQDLAPEASRKVIRQAIVAANKDILAAQAADRELQTMGTTIVLALWREGQGMYIAGVGDSRAYLARGDKIEQLTVDHTLAQALVENKTITAAEAKTHRFRNVLWKYLGTREVGDGPEVKLVTLQPGERMLLCTDGLHAVVSDEKILAGMHRHADVQKCADALTRLALDSGSRDNVSCLVIERVEKR